MKKYCAWHLIRSLLVVISVINGTYASMSTAVVGDYEGTSESGEGGDSSSSSSSESADISELTSTRLKLMRLNTLPPNPSLPVDVTVSLAIESIKSIGVDARIDIYLEYTWYDTREINQSVFLSGRKSDTFAWIPDIYFLLAREVIYIDRTQYVYADNGHMLFDQKVTISIPCIPDPFHYPFDKVECVIRLSSYGFDDSQIAVSWKGSGISFPEAYQKLEYIGFEWAPGINKQISSKPTDYGGNTFTVLRSSMTFQRLYSVYLIQLFIPAAILVIISWSTAWVNMAATPGRATIGVTTILTMLTLTTNRKQDSDSKYLELRTSLLDIYLWVCFFYVILAFVEFSWSDYYRAGKKDFRVPVFKFRMNGKRLNVISRFLFPLTFLLFNSFFWGYVFMGAQR